MYQGTYSRAANQRPRIIKKHCQSKLLNKAFTLTELLISIVILGVLSSIAIPRFFGQLQRTCQDEAANNLNLLANSASAYKDIYGVAPTTWSDLNDISAVMTTTGPATGDLTNGIITPSCDYKLSKSSASSGDQFIFIALPPPYTEDAPFKEKDMYNVVSCFDLSNGASDLKKGKYLALPTGYEFDPDKSEPPRLQKEIDGRARVSDLVC
jgi:prepilin-type N-terminal cleavage/methylation domain-containing protein